MDGARRRLVTVVGAVALGGLALLIWAKLRMVAGVPRTALAEPKQVMAPRPPEPRPQPGPPAGDSDHRREQMGD